jgi:2-dehydropantoate 2-reductase
MMLHHELSNGGKMRIAVVGLGGVGGYIGAKLCALEDEVVFVARGKHAEAIREKGLLINEDGGSFRAHADAVVGAEELEGELDLMLLCVKSYDITEAVDALRKNITPETIIIPFANGVEHAGNIAKMVRAKVLGGSVHILAHKEEDGVVRRKGKVFAAFFGSERHSEEAVKVAALFEKAGLRCKVPEVVEKALWKKYLFISAFAALTSYYDMGIKAVSEAHAEEAGRLLEEIAKVAAVKGIDIASEAKKALETASSLPPEASTSMHRDFQHRRKTELETLCGYLVREAEARGIEVPVMRRLYAGLLERVRGESGA